MLNLKNTSMQFVWLITSLFALNLIAAPLKVVIPSDSIIENNETPDFLAGKLLINLSEYLAGKVEFELVLASRNREWRMLEKRDDVCLYNKTKTPKRQVLAHYSQLPLAVYPPNRLIVRKQSGNFHDHIELATIVEKYGLMIGVVAGRSYGVELDDEIDRLKSKLFINGGEFNAERLHKILQLKRLDGVIEYSRVFMERLDSPEDAEQYSFIQLDEARDFSYGYIACSRSELGKKAISYINNAMASHLMKELSLMQHQKTFPIHEFIFIKRELEFLWQENDFGIH